MSDAITVLMYHALARGDGRTEGADPHYAVSRAQFRRHLQMIGAAGKRVSSVAELLGAHRAQTGCVAFTFDDGHVSNAEAVEDLVAHGGSADFFVNPGMVGKRHHLSWTTLRAMADAGMSIQSHGQNHRYLDELCASEVEAELADSKREIEDRLGRAVAVFAPPGGRVVPGLGDLARRVGYRAVCSSRAGLWRPEGRTWDVPRMAVLASTSDTQLRRWVEQNALDLAVGALRYRLLGAAKGVLGNERYERFRRALLGVASPGAGR